MAHYHPPALAWTSSSGSDSSQGSSSSFESEILLSVLVYVQSDNLEWVVNIVLLTVDRPRNRTGLAQRRSADSHVSVLDCLFIF